MVSPYLVCPIGVGESCRADPTGYARYTAECAVPGVEVFSTWVESNETWAAAGTCVWTPSVAEIAMVSEALVALMIQRLEAHATTATRDSRLDPIATDMARAYGNAVVVGDGENYDQIRTEGNRLEKYGSTSGWFPFRMYSPSLLDIDERFGTLIDTQMYGVDFSAAGRINTGAGAAVVHGGLFLYTVYAG